MKILKTYKWLILIVFLGIVLRFWQLGNIPPSLDWDEAALGYNAYSILKTGKDEYGVFLPRVLRSFDDYKPPLYAYLAIPSIAVFGLEPWAVRLPSAVMGIFAIIGTYFLVRELVKLTKREGLWENLPLISAFLLAISPWHIQFSRIAFEANTGVTLNIWAVTSFLYGLKSRGALMVAAFLSGMALYAYHSERIFVPLIFLFLAILFWKQLCANKKSLIIALFVGVITILPLIPVVFTGTSVTRLAGTSSLADQTALLANTVKKLQYDESHNIFWGVIFDNRRLVWLQTVLTGYLSHFSFRWLFLTGDNPRHHAPDMAPLYLWEMPFLLWGIFQISKKGGLMAKILCAWFLISPIAASPTTGLPHAIRTLVFLPTFQIFTGVGVLEFLNWLKGKKTFLKKIVCVAASIFVSFNIIFYLHMYFGHLNHEDSYDWQYGYKETVDYVKSHSADYDKIVVSTRLEQPYMFFLFYLKYDPVQYLAEGGTHSGGFAEYKNKFDKYEFRPINWISERRDGTVLYVGSPGEIPAPDLVTIHYLNGEEAMRIASK